MWSCCLKCKKKIKSKNPSAVETKNGKIMPLSKCEISNSKRSRSIKKQKASGLLISLRIKKSLSIIALVCCLLF